MAITSSTITEDRAQADGRRRIVERHTRDDGPDYFVTYLAPAGDDVSARMAARVADLNATFAAEASERANFPVLASILTKLSDFNQSRSNAVLQASVASGGANLTLGERILYRAITA